MLPQKSTNLLLLLKKLQILRGGSENRRLPLEQFTCDLAKALARGLMSFKHVLRNVQIARGKNIDMDGQTWVKNKNQIIVMWPFGLL